MEAAPAPFVTYTRMVKETQVVAQVTPENVGALAALISGKVDYSADKPALVVIYHGREWRVSMGEWVSLTGGSHQPQIMRSSDINRNGGWEIVP